jgi:hypothetical protein
MFNKPIQRVLASIICTALICMPISQVLSQEYKSYCCDAPEEKQNWSWLKDLAIFAGAATVGVLAGVVAGNNSSKHCHCKDPNSGQTGPVGIVGPTGATGAGGRDGCTGALGPRGFLGPSGSIGPTGWMGVTGPTGPAAYFEEDNGQSIIVNLVGIFPTAATGTLTAIAFVTLPDGVTIEGPLEILIGGSHSFTPLDISNPLLGTYSTGIQLINTNESVNGITLNGSTVTATRGGLHLVNLLVPLAGNTILPGKSLISTTFIYDAEDIP